MLKLVFFTERFYKDHEAHDEIEQKDLRPYVQIKIIVNGILWGIPLRSHINHEYVIWTDKENGCGIDLSKSVVITDPGEYISMIKPHIRDNEFKVIKQLDEYMVVKKLQKYIKEYKKAKQKPNIPRNKMLLKCSTLQYFEEYI